MIQDKNKNITVTYNYMNLPTVVDFGNNNKIVWTYSVSGAKLRKTVYTNNSITMVQDYVSGFVYKNSQLDFFGMEEGRVKKLTNGTLQYQYTIKDHLGNTRVMFADVDNNGTIDPNTEILQEDHYYAFGLRIEGLSSSSKDNKFTYNGKELEDDHGLNWYHYGARYYDPALGRWHAVDPLDEMISTYGFVANNPIKLTDPDGTSIDPSKAQASQNGYNSYYGTNYDWLGDWLKDMGSKAGLVLTYTPGENNLRYTIDEKNTSYSETMRKDIIAAIESTWQVFTMDFTFTKGSNTIGNDISLNPDCIKAFIEGVNGGLDKTALGWALTFMHELGHTDFKGMCGVDNKTSIYGDQGMAVIYENIIRDELNKKGGQYGERMSYIGVLIHGNAYLFFSKTAFEAVMGYPFKEAGYYIKGDPTKLRIPTQPLKK